MPRIPLTKPPKGWQFRILGFTLNHDIVDHDDTHYIDVAQKVADEMLSKNCDHYKQGAKYCVIYDEADKIVRTV